jgi:NAD(P)-dependent dehydrogenase (short-subunit alcohol dehydrogenase family)
MDQEHRGRTAVITGGGRGFGKAFGHALAARGALAVLLDLDGEAAQAAAAEIVAAGGEARAIACDVADALQVSAAMAEAADFRGGIDILINNAGLHSAAYGLPMTEMGLAKTRRLFDVNIMGVVNGSLAAREFMAGRPGATIVSISSAASYPPLTAYGVSKLAVRGLTMALAKELGPVGVRVNAIAPGLIFTDTIRAELSPAVVEGVMRQQDLKREGAERDVVEALLYLVSDRASFVTGETLKVTGGFAAGF